MAKCKDIPFKTAEANAKSWLKAKGIIDKFLNILDYKKFLDAQKYFREQGIKNYNINANWFFAENNGTKAIPNQSAFAAVDVKNNGKHYYKDVMPITDSDFFDPSTGEEQADRGVYDKYIQFKKTLMSQLKDRLARIKNLKKKYKGNPDKTKRLIKLETEIKNTVFGSEELGIKGLEDEIRELSENQEIAAFAEYAEKDMERLDNLAQSNNVDDIKEARKIINFYKEVGTFDATKDHPLFEKDEIFDDNGNLLLNEETAQQYREWANIAEDKENIINQQEVHLVEQQVNTNSKVRKLYGDKELTYQDLTRNLKDTSWLDMMVMDITNGIFSKNGILPQVMMNTLQNKWEEKQRYAKNVEQKMNELQPEVENILKDMGYSLNSLGILGVKGVSYELFKQKYKDGSETGRAVHRYSPEFFDARGEMESKFRAMLNKAKEEKDSQKRRQKIKQAYDVRKSWFRNNTVMLDVRKLPEVFENEEFAEFSNHFLKEESEAHVELLKKTLGEQGYQEEVDKQLDEIRKYKVQHNVFVENYLEEKGVNKIEQLNEKDKAAIEFWEKTNDPFYGVANFYTEGQMKIGNTPVSSYMSYNISAPRRNKVEYAVDPQGDIQFSEKEGITGYYDSSYEKIESNPTLKDFYDTMSDVLKTIRDNMPADVQEKLNVNSIPVLKKNIIEILLDKNTSFFKSMSVAAREIYERIWAILGINKQSEFSYAKIDAITGKPEYQVNSAFLGSNKEKINNAFLIESTKFMQQWNMDNPKLQMNRMGKFTFVKFDNLSPQAINMLAEAMGVDTTRGGDAVQAVRSVAKDDKVPVGKILIKSVTHRAVQEQSFDIPKILKMYSYLTMEYAARNEILPMMEIMKKHYEEIKNPSTNNIGQAVTNALTGETRTEGIRNNAVKQINNWFERSVLGNYGTKHSGLVKRVGKILPKTKKGKIKFLGKEFSGLIDGKIRRPEEKEMIREINELIAKENDEERIEQLEEIKGNIGRDFSLSAAFGGLMNFIRFKGLGWNLSSSVTNFMEGQTANFIVAASGDYFTPENIYRGMDVTKGSWIKTMSFGKLQTPGAKKARVLMDRYRILQDASNELQKASSKSAISGITKYEPYEIVKRVEYLNQTPLMIATLLDVKITDKDGNVSNVWDEMNEDGKLNEAFRTEENVANWENADGQAYNDYKSHINKTIVVTHGDYDELRGNVATSYHEGQALLMFKRWMGRQVYQRFAVQQDDIETGIKDFKGRYFSHTKSSGALHGALVGLATMGPVGAAGGFIIGAGLGKFYGSDSGMNMIQEMAFNLKALFKKSLGMPINVLAGKEVFSDSNYDQLVGGEFTERDAKNMRANITDMALLMTYTALTLMTKAMLWDDDDKGEDTRRKAHNLLANRFLQLASQAMMYVSPYDTWDNTVGSVAFLRFLDDVKKTANSGSEFLAGNDVISSGPNAGESRLMNNIEKTFYPSIAKDFVRPILKGDIPSFGFEAQMQRQFEPSPFDKWFFGQEKLDKLRRKAEKAARKAELESDDLQEDEIKDILNEEYPRQYKKK